MESNNPQKNNKPNNPPIPPNPSNPTQNPPQNIPFDPEDDLFNQIKDQIVNHEPLNYNNNNSNPIPPMFFFNPLSNNASNNTFLTSAIQRLQTGDDMDIMSELMNLSDKLSLATDQLGANPNMPKLLEEICKNLDKLYLPEIIIYSLQCINYILDANSRLSNTLKKINAVPKIATIINGLEDISCLDLIVTVFEKISQNNAILLLENNIFLSLLNVIDFLGSAQRKLIMKCCQNISMNVINFQQFESYIKPGFEILCYLTKYNDNDMKTTEGAISIYYNLVLCLKDCIYDEYKKDNLSNELDDLLTNNCVMENLCEILNKYFIERDKNVNCELVKKILLIISNSCDVSNKLVDKLFSIHLLPTLSEIIHYEFNYYTSNTLSTYNVGNNNNTDLKESSSTFLSELFNVLTSFFPIITNNEENKEEKDNSQTKILAPKNKKYYDYFCQEILMPLINNIMEKSACSNLNNLIKLVLSFVKTTSKENIIIYVDSKPLAQIISKLLDTKYPPYINDLISLIEILMSKVPEHFIKNFIREGIIEALKNYKIDSNKDNNDDNDNNENKEKMLLQKLIKDFEKGIGFGQNDLISKENKLLLKKLEAENNLLMKRPNEKIISKKINDLVNKYLQEEQIEKYLQTKISNSPNNINSKNDDLTNLKDILNYLEKDLVDASNPSNIDKEKMTQTLKTILEILLNPSNEITLFEIENSNILKGLCTFLEPNFMIQFDKLIIENENQLQKNIDLKTILPSPLIKNEYIIERLNLFFENIKDSKEKLINLIKLIQYSITSMNCFTMIVDDAQNTNLNSYYSQALLLSKKFNVKVYYDEQSYKEKILNNQNINDDSFSAKLSEFNLAFKNIREFRFLLGAKTCFEDICSQLLSYSNIPYVENEKYNIEFNFFLNLNTSKIKDKFSINKKWGIKELKDKLIEKYGKVNAESVYGVPIFFGIDYKRSDDFIFNNINDNENNIFNQDGYFKKYSFYNGGINTYEKEIFFDKYSFLKDYHCNIIYSQSLYEIKRLMPSLFLLSIFHLVIKKYHKLFNLNSNWFKNKEEWDNLFINSKVTLLISKACSDGYSVAKSSLPSWCKNLSIDCGYLSKFDSRQLLFKVSFDPLKSLINLQNYLKSIDPNYPNNKTISIDKNMRLKIIVERNKILEHGFKIVNNPMTSKFNGFLEFEYLGEIGNGLGPTLEFYSLIVEKIYEQKYLWYNTTDKSLYPSIGLNNNMEALKIFKLLGYIVGRVIYDDRLLDLPLSRILWDLLLEKSVSFNDIKLLDKYLYKVIQDFLGLIEQKKILMQKNENISKEEIENNVLYNGHKLSEVDIYFTFPGYNDVELKQNGKNILLTMENIEEYVNLIYDFLFYKGINKVIEAFKQGFNIIYDINNLKIFTSIELEEMIFGNCENKWDEETLTEFLKPEHGYTKNSNVFKYLIKYMAKLNNEEQKQFLLFSTGCSRLPVGGFKALSPKLTIVKKTFNVDENPDEFLPTVMTCQNYLKIPEYSSYEILENKFKCAVNEGNKEFQLS